MGKIIQNYLLQEVIGQGVYGKVYRGVNTKTKEEVAIKVIKAERFRDTPKLEECVVNQIKTLSKIDDNQHIVKYIDMLKTPNNFYFVYEYCNGGTLEQVMQQYRNTPDKVMPESKAISYFRQLLDAFKVLNRYNVVHRDLKPDNILLHNGVIKIGDFGFSKSLSTQQQMIETMLGSPIYMAPEVLKGQNYTIKADIWSLGVVLYEMLVGQCPYKSGSIAKLIQVLQSTDAVIPKTVNLILEKLLKRMLTKDFRRRIDWQELFEAKLTDETQSKNTSTANTANSGNSFAYSGNKQFSTSSSPNGNLRTTNKIMQTWQDVQSQDGQQRRRSPNHNELAVQPNYSLRATVATNNSPPLYMSKSPMVDSSSNPISEAMLQHMVDNHRRCCQIVKLSMEVLEKGSRQSWLISYIVVKMAEKQLIDINQALRKQMQKSTIGINQRNQYQDFSQTIDKEMNSIQILLNFYRDEIMRGPDSDKISCLLSAKGKHLKAYIESLNLDNMSSIENYMHASQLLDFFDDKVLLKKDAYQRISKEQLSRQVLQKLQKL